MNSTTFYFSFKRLIHCCTVFQINGASWRGNQVVLDSDTNQPFYTSEFSISFSNKRREDEANCVTLPLYSNSSRNCQICDLQVRTSSTKEAVILSGAALVVPDY